MKKQIENISKALPSFFKNLGDYFKSNFDDHGKEILSNATGTAGVIVSLFGQPLIDRYFNTLQNKKLENFGLNLYIKAALTQANKSINGIEKDLNEDLTGETLFNIINNSIQKEIENISDVDTIFIFQPKYHPAIEFVRNTYIHILKEVQTKSEVIKEFVKNFNENIGKQIIEEFGNDYEKHIEQTKEFRFKDSELELLLYMKGLGKIGFKESENLKYEETFGEWKELRLLKYIDDVHEEQDLSIEDYEKRETGQKPLRTIIEQYFNKDGDNHLEKILFVIADFGKGKSIFLKRHASELAKSYMETKVGYIPIYFNLRNFNKYSSETKLGVIGDYLETEFGIKIDDEHFKKNSYIFLIDSLDESGPLNKPSIDKVISSVKKIQNIDKTICRRNKIIITSRPFDDGLENHLSNHHPMTFMNKENRPIVHFLSVYGFKKEQFNDWIQHSLKSNPSLASIKSSGLGKKIINSNLMNKEIDIYSELISNQTLSRSELRRPIFAYMIYQLILHEIDFLAVGKIGVYLSFLNLLTKEAKYIHDKDHKINLNDQFDARNILHGIAALWMHNRKSGVQGILKKADICRTLEGVDKKESDQDILSRFRGKGINEMEFLSHSYFGENDNILHFQHQSFAEILLAEYYLKVFIKFALDAEFDVEEARLRLVLGEPTEQTIQFLSEMLKLLRETAVSGKNKDLLEKRKLLFPLMASLSTLTHNKMLFSNELHYSWFKNYSIPDNITEIPSEYIENWCISDKHIEKIIDLAKSIMGSSTNYLRLQGDTKTSLYNNETISIQSNVFDLPPDIDRWLALLVGNILYNNEDEQKFFCSRLENFNKLFELIRNWNYSSGISCPSWGTNLFKGIDMSKNDSLIAINHLNFSNIDFSYSFLKKINGFHTFFHQTIFNNVTFENVNLGYSAIVSAEFRNIKIVDRLELHGSLLTPEILIPPKLASLLSNGEVRGRKKHSADVPIVLEHSSSPFLIPVLDLFTYLYYNKNFSLDKIQDFVTFLTLKEEKHFIDRLKKQIAENNDSTLLSKRTLKKVKNLKN